MSHTNETHAELRTRMVLAQAHGWQVAQAELILAELGAPQAPPGVVPGSAAHILASLDGIPAPVQAPVHTPAPAPVAAPVAAPPPPPPVPEPSNLTVRPGEETMEVKEEVHVGNLAVGEILNVEDR